MVPYLGWLGLALTLLLNPSPLAAQNKEAEAAYESAVGLLKLDLWEQSAESYREYFKNHPRHAFAGQAHLGLGLCHFNLLDYAAAARELKAAANSRGPNQPDPVEVNSLLGLSLLMKRPPNPGDAEEAFEASINSLGISKSGVLIRTWESDKVKKWLGKNKDAKRREIAADVFKGLLEAAYMQGEWKSVINKTEAFEELIKGADVEQRVRVLTGEAQEKTGAFQAAAAEYETAAKLEGKDGAEALFRLGMVRLDHLRNFEGAAADFHRFTEKYKNDKKQPNAAFNEALCYHRSYEAGKKAHLKDAIDRFDAFAKDNPRHDLTVTALFSVGVLQHSEENWAAAVKALEPIMGNSDPALGQLVFFVANSHHHLENWEKSAKFYMEFAKGNEQALNADVALHNAGVAFSNLNKPDFDKAIAAYELLERKCPGSRHLPSAQLKLGIIHFEAGRFEEAQGPFKKIPARHPLRADADYFLAWTDLDNANPAGAAKRFGQLSARLKKSSPGHRLIPMSDLYEGTAELERGRFGDAEKILSKFVADYSKHKMLDEAAFNLGQAQMNLLKWGSAIKSFERVPDDSYLHERALYQSAQSNLSAGKPVEAIPFFEALLEQHPKSSLVNNVTFALAELEFETGGEKGGADSVKRLLALLEKKPAPDLALRQQSLYKLGIVFFDQKNMAASAKAFEDLLKNVPPHLVIDAAWQAGEARTRIAGEAKKRDDKDNEHRAALKNYEIASNAKIPKGSDEVRLMLLKEQAVIRIGKTKASLEQWVASQKTYEQFIEAHPKHRLIRTAYQGLGWALQNQEKYPAAIKSLERAVVGVFRDDVGARAQFLLGECYLEQENYNKAIIEFSKVETLYLFPKWQSMAAYEMAQALLRQDDRAGARRHFQRLVKSYPDTPAATAAQSALKRLN
jgi:TolA-binding protein